MTEFTVILYAGGTNHFSIDSSLPKCLLPIGNRPLIWYPLQLIRSHSSLSQCPLLILTSSIHSNFLDEYLSTLNLNYELISSRHHRESASDDQQQLNNELGTLDILRSCYSRIRTESICLLTCDLFGKFDLTQMINQFRIKDASLMMLLLPLPSSLTTSTGKDSIVQPGQKTKFISEPEFYTIDSSTETITSIRLKADLDDYFPLRQNILIKHPRTIIRNDLVDAHLYLIKKSALDIAIRSKYSSFRKEFLPKMIRQSAIDQPLEHLITSTSNSLSLLHQQKTFDYNDCNDLSKILNDYHHNEMKSSINYCYYTIGDSQLFRVKHVLSYLEANRQVTSVISFFTNEDITFKDKIEQVQISSDCVIGDSSDIGKKTTLKRTIIGRNCRIEEKCKITNCVLHDNVHIREGVTLHNSILCSRSTIGMKSDIQNSIICANQQVEPNKKLNCETVSSINVDNDTYMIYDDEP